MNDVRVKCNCYSALAVVAASMMARCVWCVEPHKKILDMASVGFTKTGHSLATGTSYSNTACSNFGARIWLSLSDGSECVGEVQHKWQPDCPPQGGGCLVLARVPFLLPSRCRLDRPPTSS